MKAQMHIELSSNLIEQITAHFPTKIYRISSTLFYEGHTPISGYLIVEGCIQISKKKKIKKILSRGALIGISDFINRRQSEISAEVTPFTEVCFLDKGTMESLVLEFDNEMARLLKSFLEIK